VVLPAVGTTILVSFWISGVFLKDIADSQQLEALPDEAEQVAGTSLQELFSGRTHRGEVYDEGAEQWALYEEEHHADGSITGRAVRSMVASTHHGAVNGRSMAKKSVAPMMPDFIAAISFPSMTAMSKLTAKTESTSVFWSCRLHVS